MYIPFTFPLSLPLVNLVHSSCLIKGVVGNLGLRLAANCLR